MNLNKLDPLDMLIFFKRNQEDSRISNVKKINGYKNLNDLQKGMILNILINYLFKNDKTPILSDKEILFSIKSLNIKDLLNNERFLKYFKNIIHNSKKSKELMTLLYSKLLIVDSTYPIDEELNYNQNVYINSEFSTSPFYLLLCKDKNRCDEFKHFFKNQNYISKKELNLIITFLLENQNYKLIYFICKNTKTFSKDIINQLLTNNIYSLEKKPIDKQLFFQALILLWENSRLSIDAKKDILLKILNYDFMNKPWVWEQAKLIEDSHNGTFSFCQKIGLNLSYIENIKKYKLNTEFNIKNRTPGYGLSYKLLSRILTYWPNHYRDITPNPLLDRQSSSGIKESINNITIKEYNNIIPIFDSHIDTSKCIFDYFNPGGLDYYLQEQLKKIKTKEELSLLLFNKKSPKSKKSLNLLLDGIFLREERIFWTFYLTKYNFNYDLILNFLDTIKSYPILTIAEKDIEFFFSELRFYFTDKKILELLSTLYYQCGIYNLNISPRELDDTISQLKKIIDSESKDFAFKEIKEHKKSIKKFQDFHSFLSKNIMKFISQKDFILHQEEFLVLNNLSFEDFTLHIPNSNHDLINCGNELNICVGDGYYADSINKKDIIILFLKKNNKTLYCVEWSLYSNSISQAKGESNKDLNSSSISNLTAFILKSIEKKEGLHYDA